MVGERKAQCSNAEEQENWLKKQDSTLEKDHVLQKGTRTQPGHHCTLRGTTVYL